jgi:hypothetical protein
MAFGRHVVECRNGIGKSASEAAKRAVCRVICRHGVVALRRICSLDEGVWSQDPDRLRRWINQNKKSSHWPATPMTRGELIMHRKFLEETMHQAPARRLQWYFGQYADDLEAEIATAEGMGYAEHDPSSVFERRREHGQDHWSTADTAQEKHIGGHHIRALAGSIRGSPCSAREGALPPAAAATLDNAEQSIREGASPGKGEAPRCGWMRADGPSRLGGIGVRVQEPLPEHAPGRIPALLLLQQDSGEACEGEGEAWSWEADSWDGIPTGVKTAG